MNKCEDCLCLECELEHGIEKKECEFNDCIGCEKYGVVRITRCRKYIEKGRELKL